MELVFFIREKKKLQNIKLQKKTKNKKHNTKELQNIKITRKINKKTI